MEKGPYFYISNIISKHMKMLCFKCQQNRTVNEEFDFFEGGAGATGRPFINCNLNYYY